MMKTIQQVGALLLYAVMVLSFAACSKNSDKKISEINSFIAEKTPEEYTSAEGFQSTVTAQDDGSYLVTLNLPFYDEDNGSTKEDFFDTIAFESSYLVDSVYADPPYPLTFIFNYSYNGEDVGSVKKAHDSTFYERTVDGTTDTFAFQ